jgi:uncharacterized membrane-anchored protein
MTDASPSESFAGKVAQVTFAFWIIKICATTLGETGGDALSMTVNLGYVVSTFIFLALFIVTVSFQIAAKRYHPFLYWSVIVATTTVGTTTSDYITRDAGLGYIKGSILLLAGVLVSLTLWRIVTGSVSISKITTKKAEAFYWVTILISNTLGTALGDYTADDSGLGYDGSAILFAGFLIVLASLYFWTKISRPALFWAAFILTRPLGATLGDLLTKPHSHGGFDLSRISSSLLIAACMIPVIALWSKKPEQPVVAQALA